MVNADVRKSATGVTSALQNRNIVGVAMFSALGVGGLFLAQEVTDQLMPFFNMSSDPTSATGLGANALVKVLMAAVLVALASRGSSMVMAAAGTVAFGMLVSAGLDFVDVLQRGGLPGSAPSPSRMPSGNPSPGPSPSPSPSRTPSPSPSPSPTPARSSASADNGSFR